MHISVDIQWLLTTLLGAIRVGAIFLLTPILAVTQAPVRFRVLFVIALAMILVTAMGQPLPVQVPLTIGGLAESALYELFIGSLMAFGIFAAFGAFLVGGRILDFQLSFGVANLIDPATDTQTAMFGTILNLIAVMMFFMIDAHHLLIRGIAYSFEALPIGTAVSEMNFGAIVAQFGAMFIFSIMVAAPVLFSILILDLGLGVMARTMPQINIFFVSMPLRIFMGLVVIALSIRYLSPLMEKIFKSIFVFWDQILG